MAVVILLALCCNDSLKRIEIYTSGLFYWDFNVSLAKSPLKFSGILATYGIIPLVI